jgi:hypothetical protein
MAILAVLVTTALLITACTGGRPFPGSKQENALFREFLKNRGHTLPSDSQERAGGNKGDFMCDRNTRLPLSDEISQKFYEDHICLVRNNNDLKKMDLTAFCRDFRKGQPLYQVMLLSPAGIRELRNDIASKQGLFMSENKKFPPLKAPPSGIHFYTDDQYTFIECKQSGSTWKGKQLSNRYQQYIPKGTPGNPGGQYQIYHGCPPVKTKPGTSAAGPC